MELRDLIVTPIVIGLVYACAYWVRPYVTDNITRRYFLPALTVRIIGALAVGFIYQFYYDGGDTFKYHTYGSRRMWEIFIDSPIDGVKLLIGTSDIYSRFFFDVPIIRDPPSFFVGRVSFVFDLFTFSSYSATAVLFAVWSFVGMWLLFTTFRNEYPSRHASIAIATLFIPSVFFWGSGILKDTLAIGAIGFSTYAFYRLVLKRQFTFGVLAMLIVSIVIVYNVKMYILFCFIPSLMIWGFSSQLSRLRSTALKLLMLPAALLLVTYLAYYSISKLGAGSDKYAVDNLAETVKTTAYDIRYYTGASAGSGYDLGALDGTFSGMIRLIPQAILVSLFRPYVWEASNLLMLISSLECLAILLLTCFVLVNARSHILTVMMKPNFLFCVVFSLSFAFAVGVSTYNFGTLTRYRIPLVPFYVLATVILFAEKSERKLAEFD